jgi:phosphatidylinositol-3-phosphatase
MPAANRTICIGSWYWRASACPREPAGALLLSPLIKPGTVSAVDYKHYSLLRSIEDIFGPPHLGDVAMWQVRSFGPDAFG